MTMETAPVQTEQVQATLSALSAILGDGLLAVYLHGSAASGGLRLQSDIDLLAIVDRALSVEQREALLSSLLRLSGRHPAAPNGPRCLEVMVFSRSDLTGRLFPARAEFVYGEWLREAFDAGEKPVPARDPEYTLVLAQARQEAMTLLGPGRHELLPGIGSDLVRQAMRDQLPVLLDQLHEDTRNTLLTLARMWRTASTGDFVPKDVAANWATPSLGSGNGSTLDYARRAYLGEVADDWQSRRGAAQRLADELRQHIVTAMAAHGMGSENSPSLR
jgi:predicted nucleotidyltransferase